MQKGDELDLLVNNNQLTITTHTNNTKESISFSLQNVDDQTIRWLLSALHKYGYEEIELFYSTTQQLKLVGELLKDLFTGFTILEQSEKRIVIGSITNDALEQFDVVLRRAFRVTLAMAEQVAENLAANNIAQLEETKLLEKTNNQLTNFCERLINKKNMFDYKKSHFLYVCIWNLEKIADNYKYLCDYSLKHKELLTLTKDCIILLTAVNKFFKEYYELYFLFSLEKMNLLAEQKTQVSAKIKSYETKNADEQYFIIIITQILTQTADFSASFIALNHEKESADKQSSKVR